jgi:hypothetical protein
MPTATRMGLRTVSPTQSSNSQPPTPRIYFSSLRLVRAARRVRGGSGSSTPTVFTSAGK